MTTDHTEHLTSNKENNIIITVIMSPPPPLNQAFNIYDLPDYWLRLLLSKTIIATILQTSMQAHFKYCNRDREAEAVPATEYLRIPGFQLSAMYHQRNRKK